MTKIMTVCGTRPELIRLSRIIPKLDELCEHIFVWTGQNFDPKLSDIFFTELRLRKPDRTFYEEMYDNFHSQLFAEMPCILEQEKPDKVLVLGDTHSALAAVCAERAGIPVYHMEAGNRCYDRKVPEELNRRIIDHTATYNLPYTPRARENLLREGLDPKFIFECGNPIKEVMQGVHPAPEVFEQYGIEKVEPYCLCTFHRAECVDNESNLMSILEGLDKIAQEIKILVSVHPRTRSKLEKLGTRVSLLNKNIVFSEPMGFNSFVNLTGNATILLTDSGTATEEATIFHTPVVIMRNTTERPETLEVGAAMLSGIDSESIYSSYKIMRERPRDWPLPIGYKDTDVSNKVCQFILGRGV